MKSTLVFNKHKDIQIKDLSTSRDKDQRRTYVKFSIIHNRHSVKKDESINGKKNSRM